MTNEDLKQIAELLDTKLEPITKRLDNIEERLDVIEDEIEEIKENTEITRDVLNSVVEWIDHNFTSDYPFPVGKKEAI